QSRAGLLVSASPPVRACPRPTSPERAASATASRRSSRTGRLRSRISAGKSTERRAHAGAAWLARRRALLRTLLQLRRRPRHPAAQVRTVGVPGHGRVRARVVVQELVDEGLHLGRLDARERAVSGGLGLAEADAIGNAQLGRVGGSGG